jgi:predicted dehydrogenase
MLRVGIVGLGFMGWIHWLAWQRLRGVKVSAVSDPKPKRLKGDWRGLKGNFGPSGEKVDLKGAAGYLDWHELIQDPTIDLVDITLPTALHAEVAIAALRAGKHVLCEKPMALTAKDCQPMIAAANRSGRQLMIAHVLPFFPEYEWALREIGAGTHGEILGGSFKRITAEPTWMANYWSPEHIGGPMLDLHVHDAHFMRLLFGMPTAVTTSGRLRGELAEFWHSQFAFAERQLAVQATGGVMRQSGRTFNHGFEIHLERATLAFEFAVLKGQGRYLLEPTMLLEKVPVRHPKLRGSDPIDAFVAELREACRALHEERPSALLSPELARDAIQICEAEAKSLSFGRTVRL